MKRAQLLAVLLIAIHSYTYAQHRKVPIEHDDNAYTGPDNYVRPGKPASYTRVTFSNTSGHFDTTGLEIVKYGENGKLLQTDVYEYGPDKDFDAPPFDMIDTHIGQGKRVKYTYDAQGHLKSKKEYDVIPANSMLAVWYAAMAEVAREKRNNLNDDRGEDDPKKKDSRAKFVRDLIDKGIPEQSRLKKETRYDADGNEIFTSEPEEKHESRYVYTYDARGNVMKKRELFNRGVNDKIGGVTIYETRYSYIDGNKLDAADAYYMGNDTNHIGDGGVLTEYVHYSYNVLGKPYIITFQKDGMEYIHRLSYADTMVEQYMVVSSRTTDMVPKIDTSFITNYKYDYSHNRVVVNMVSYYDGKPSSTMLYENGYNKDGLPVEVRKYMSDYGVPGSLVEQTLFLYGTADDKNILDRSLSYRRPAKRHLPPSTREKSYSTSDPGEQRVSDRPVEEPAPVEYTVSAPPDREQIFTIVEQMPQFKGDFAAFIKKNLRYPPEAKKAGVEGRVYVKFVVTREGKVTKPEVVRSLGSACDKEALRLVSIMPSWMPGKQNGMAVPVYFTVPISFILPQKVLRTANPDEVGVGIEPAPPTSGPVEPPPGQQPIFTYVEQAPQFPGDVAGMNSFIAKNLRYPAKAKAAGIEGRVIVKFVVQSDGRATDAQVLRGIGSGCDEEALRIVSIMPKWTPGKQNGKAVSVFYTIPIVFRLDN